MRASLPSERCLNARRQFFRTQLYMGPFKNRLMATWDVVNFEAAFHDLGPAAIVGAL
jgi:hypothetical protein